MMANAVEMQQLLMSMDPSSANQFNVMNKGGACVMTASGGSASPTSSSGAPSSSSIIAEADEKEQFIQSQMLHNGIGANQWMQMLLQQQHQQEKQKSAEMADMMQNSAAIMELLANGNGELAKIAAQLAQQQNKPNDHDAEEQREATPSPPPAVSINSTLAAMVLPTTSASTGCSAASTTSSVDSSASSVIVNGHTAPQSASDDDESMQPSAKKQRTGGDETPVTPTANAQLMNFLAQMTLPNPLQQQQQNQKQMKDDSSMMFSQLFPHSGLPLMFQSPLHQQFAGMQDFEQLSALSTPNKGNGVKRQYSSNGKNYCDICNKEVCNKYFLRTHMLKMHGIVIDENKTVIANIDTSIKEREGELTFRCDTCKTMFKTRNHLRQHRQDAHGVLPLSTPRNNQNKPSVPTTPNGANNNTSAPNSASLNEEKCNFCEKRCSPSMMMTHISQEHLGNVAATTTNGATSSDISQIVALLHQQMNRGQASSEEKDLDVLDCTECSYKTRDAKNLELHLERHHKMNEAKMRVGDDEEDAALKHTTEVAYQMVVQNQFDGDSTAAALNLTCNKDGIKKELEDEKAEKNHDRNSHTSGSISPTSSIPEGFAKNIGEKEFQTTQSFVIRCKDECGEFLTEFLAQLPVRSVIDGPRKMVFELLPAPTI